MHPVLGKAVMTVLGLSIARSDRLDIVTDTGSFHEALLANDEARVFDAVLGYPTLARQPQAIRRDVAEMAICLAGVNLAALRPEHLIELHATKAFRDFQDLLRTTAADVELDADPREYENQLRDAAQSIVDAWGDSRRAIGREAKKALYEQGAAGIVRELWLRGTGAAGTSLKAVAGIFISMVVVKATLAAPNYLHGRRHLLSRVRKAEDRGLLLRYPLGLDR
jgi:hypothetical protein